MFTRGLNAGILVKASSDDQEFFGNPWINATPGRIQKAQARKCTFLCGCKALRHVGTGQDGVAVMCWSSALLGCSEDTQQRNLTSSKHTVTRPV